MGRFFNELEDWLSAFARFNDSNTAGGAHGALAHGMSEEAARHYCHCRNQSPRVRPTGQKLWNKCPN